MEEYDVLKRLPKDNERVLSFGHETCCCQIDMEKETQWHEVIFKLEIGRYKVRATPEDNIEASMICDAKIIDLWEIPEEVDFKCRVIGVTKWKRMPQDES